MNCVSKYDSDASYGIVSGYYSVNRVPHRLIRIKTVSILDKKQGQKRVSKMSNMIVNDIMTGNRIIESLVTYQQSAQIQW